MTIKENEKPNNRSKV